ncbi:MAG: 50S ribosomal protein L11 methyltransferase [Xanthomonadales bacterium]|nr:50S ribosomal protein L11 methyltransferase [Xanthomonadales bacterium]
MQIPREQVPVFEGALHSIGALSVSLADSADHPVLEPGVGETPLWPEVTITGLFENTHRTDDLLASLCAEAPGARMLEARVTELRDQDWTRAWMDDFKPMQFGKRLWVVPRDHAVPENAEKVIQLDPGLAFGSGTHPTTRLCLEWLESQSLKGCSVLDYGCGSGILAIAAAVLGAKQVTGLDNDPQALISSRSNAANNAVAEQVEVRGPGPMSGLQYDVILANILAGALIELARGFSELCRPAGQIALSGIMYTQAEDVKAAYRPWFDGFETMQFEEWVLITAVRSAQEGQA